MRTLLIGIGWLMVMLLAGCGAEKKITGKTGTKEQVLAIINRVNTYWQRTHPEPGRSFWDNAAYHTGNMEAYYLTGDDGFRKYSELWAGENKWMGATADNPAMWKYSYGEKPEYVLFGDWQICFQTYIDLYNLQPEESKVARAREVMRYQVGTDKNDYWWWADGLYMVMPVMVKM